MNIKVLFLVMSVWIGISPLLSQKEVINILNLSGENVPIPKVDPTVSTVYLWAHPLRHPDTPGNRYRVGDWVRLDLYEYKNLESRFVYVQNPQKQQEYHFFYKEKRRELVSKKEFKSIKFSTFPKVKELLQPYKLTVPTEKKNLHEVYRWQHPNLHIISYDQQKRAYYRYRIALVIYEDPYHPEAYVIEE